MSSCAHLVGFHKVVPQRLPVLVLPGLGTLEQRNLVVLTTLQQHKKLRVRRLHPIIFRVMINYVHKVVAGANSTSVHTTMNSAYA